MFSKSFQNITFVLLDELSPMDETESHVNFISIYFK